MKIRFENLSLENFAVYPHLSVDFSVDEKRPLTIIRGENNSGKTTLMRAFVWLLFGERFIPALADSTHPIRPPWASADEDVRTRGELRFSVEQANGGEVLYKLIRSGTTKVRGGVVSYGDDALNLYRNEPGTGFLESNERLATLQRRYFPELMREFILIDADKAEDLVGGAEAKHNVGLMRKATTVAVRSLLGVEPLVKIEERLREIGSKSLSAAAKNSGDRDIEKLGNDEVELAKKIEHQKTLVSSLESEVAKLDEDVKARLAARDSEFAQFDEAQKLLVGLKNKEVTKSDWTAKRETEIKQLAVDLQSEECFGLLFAPKIAKVVEVLDPLKSDGRIPASEIALLPRLLKEDECVCGIKFSEHPERKQEVERRIEISDPKKRIADFGDQALESARELINRAVGPGAESWVDRIIDHRKALTYYEKNLRTIDDEISNDQEKLNEQGSASSGLLQESIKNFEILSERLREKSNALETAKNVLEAQNSEQRSISEKLRDAKARTESLSKAQNLSRYSQLLADVIDDARMTVETEQVKKIDDTVNSIFMDVVSAANDSHYQHVGVRRVEEATDQFEPYIIGAQGSERPIAIANGASRRAVATAMVLALSEVTGTSIPFVADSLLHAMSGSVKRKVVEYLSDGKHVGQPILFATRDDLLGRAADSDGRTVLDIIRKRSGATYTVTSEAEVGGEVVHRDDSCLHGSQSVVCKCAADEFCNICERVGDDSASYLTRVSGVNR
jgi:DNA sulfur modification protein DndD